MDKITEANLYDAIDIMIDNILTPVIYMLIDNEAVEFICFTDSNITLDTIQKTERDIYGFCGFNCEILDIREFNAADRFDIINHAQLIYSANDTVKNLFETAIISELEQLANIKNQFLERKNDTGSYYLS